MIRRPAWLTDDSFLARHWQTMFNVYLFLVFGAWITWQTWKTWSEGRLNYVEVSFAIQNVILVLLLLLRMPHRSVDMNPWKQLVALVAFCSGALFIGQPPSGGALATSASNVVTFAANVLGGICLLNLGRSFGILIALRRVKTGGLYSVIRHPMYATDILLRIGYIVSHFNWYTGLVFIASTACYIYRAVLEEQFLSRQPEYRAYMESVRYRFVPGVY